MVASAKNPRGRTRTLTGVLIEDNPDHAQLILAQLERDQSSLRLVWVNSIAEAEPLLVDSPDIVIAEMFLSGRALGDTINQLRQQCSSAVLIILSGSGDEHLAADAIKRGADEYLIKNRDTLGQLAARLAQSLADRRNAPRRARAAPQDTADPLAHITGTLEHISHELAALLQTPGRATPGALKRVRAVLARITAALATTTPASRA